MYYHEDGTALAASRAWHEASDEDWASYAAHVHAAAVQRIGRGWLAVPGDAWAALAEAVKRGDYESPARP